MAHKQIFIKIYGKVTGVNFRHYIFDSARKMDLKGYVKNCADNTVEIKASGEKDGLKQLLEFARQGPQSAKVDHLDIDWLPASNKLPAFYIKYDL